MKVVYINSAENCYKVVFFFLHLPLPSIIFYNIAKKNLFFAGKKKKSSRSSCSLQPLLLSNNHSKSNLRLPEPPPSQITKRLRAKPEASGSSGTSFVPQTAINNQDAAISSDSSVAADPNTDTDMDPEESNSGPILSSTVPSTIKKWSSAKGEKLQATDKSTQRLIHSLINTPVFLAKNQSVLNLAVKETNSGLKRSFARNGLATTQSGTSVSKGKKGAKSSIAPATSKGKGLKGKQKAIIQV